MENGAKKLIKRESVGFSAVPFLAPNLKEQPQAKIKTRPIHQIGSLFIKTLEGLKKRSLNVKSG